MSGIMNKLGLGHKDHSHDSTHHTAATTSQAANTATQARNVPVASTAANNNNVPVANAVASSAVNRNATATQQSQADLINHTSTQSTNMTSRAGTVRDVGQATASDMAAHDHSLFTQQNRLSGNDAMTRSEEKLRVAKASVPTGVAALNKTVEVEHVEKAIPVQKERVVIEREPITCSNLPKAMSGQEIKPAHFETVLREDRVAATKETVPIERIRLAKQVETSVKSVGADLAKEHIDTLVKLQSSSLVLSSFQLSIS